MEATTSSSTLVEVRPVGSPGDAVAARELFARQRQWLVGIGIDVVTAQPGASDDYEDPAAHYAPPDGALLIARLHGRPCGLVGLRALPGFPAAAELRRMFVLEDVRGHGGGRQLLAAAIRAARRLGYAELWLETLPEHMGTAVRLYRSAGFRPAPSLGHTVLPGVLTLCLRLGGGPACSPSPRPRSTRCSPARS